MVLLGKRIKELRTKYHLTQKELARQIDVTTTTITAYECDLRQPSYDVLIKLAHIFKVSIDSLLLNRDDYIIDVSNLEPEQIIKVQCLVDYFKNSDLIDLLYSKEPLDSYSVAKFKERHPEFFENIKELYNNLDE